MKKSLSILFAICSTTAFATITNDSIGSNNLYVGAAAGAAWNNVAAPATAFRLDGGYSWNQYWALEIGTTGITQSGGTPNQSMQYYDASFKGTLPIGDMFALFAQIGGAYGSPGVIGGNYASNQSPQADQAGWNALTSLGAEINITKEVSINITDHYYWGASNPQGASNVLLGGVRFNF
jgi:hypothetical protein